MTLYLNARYFLVTYPQSDGLDPWAVNDHFGQLGAECIVAREDHADGHTHLHVMCDFGRKFRSRRADIFDVDGFHPNIERSKANPRKGGLYACKDGEIVAGGLDIAQLPTRLVSTAQDQGSTLLCAESQREFFDIAEDICPGDLISRFSNFHSFAKWKWPELAEPYESPSGFAFADGAFPELVRYRTEVVGVRGKCPPTAEDTFSARGCDAFFLRTALPLGAQSAHKQMSGYVPAVILLLTKHRSWKSEDASAVRSHSDR